MILKRVEKDNLVKALYDSSNIIGSIYNTTTNELDLIFKAGTKYRYPNVSKSDYMRFEIAESQGNVFNSHIKKYSFVKLENVDIATILTEADDLKQKEDTALLEGKKNAMFFIMKDALELHGDRSRRYTDEDLIQRLTKVQTAVNDFLTLKNK